MAVDVENEKVLWEISVKDRYIEDLALTLDESLIVTASDSVLLLTIKETKAFYAGTEFIVDMVFLAIDLLLLIVMFSIGCMRGENKCSKIRSPFNRTDDDGQEKEDLLFRRASNKSRIREVRFLLDILAAIIALSFAIAFQSRIVNKVNEYDNVFRNPVDFKNEYLEACPAGRTDFTTNDLCFCSASGLHVEPCLADACNNVDVSRCEYVWDVGCYCDRGFYEYSCGCNYAVNGTCSSTLDPTTDVVRPSVSDRYIYVYFDN